MQHLLYFKGGEVVKEKITNLMKKRVTKVIIVLVIVFMVINIVEIIVTSQTASRNKEWGLKLTVSNVSSTGLTMTIERDNSERSEELTVGDTYWVEKRTLFGWKPLEYVEGGSMSSGLLAWPLDDGDSKSFNKNWEKAFGKLGPGVYRISTDALIERKKEHNYTAEDFVRNPELKEQIEQELEKDPDPVVYATFVVLF